MLELTHVTRNTRIMTTNGHQYNPMCIMYQTETDNARKMHSPMRDHNKEEGHTIKLLINLNTMAFGLQLHP